MVNQPELKELAATAPDEFISAPSLEEISSILRPEEQPYYMFKSPGEGFSRGDEPDNAGGFMSIGDSWGGSTLYVTDMRLIFVQGRYGTLRADHLPYRNITDISISTGGLLSTGQIEIQTQNHTYRGSPHKHINNKRANAAIEFIQDPDRESPEEIEEDENSIDGIPPLWCHRVIDVEIIEDYGLNLSAEKCELAISPAKLLFKPSNGFGKEEKTAEIPLTDLDFDNIGTGSRRDFESENKSRQKNLINPFRGGDSPAAKSRSSTVQIPIKNSNQYVVVTPDNSSDFDIMLSTLSLIEQHGRVTSAKSTEDQGSEKESDKIEKESPMTLLKRRLAKGEITLEEFEKRKEYLDE